MSYTEHVEKGVVVFDGPDRPPDGTAVRVEEVPTALAQPTWGEVFKDLVGAAEGLPDDMADHHDHYIHGAPKP